MADFNRKKLQIFVSSTFSDLVNERQAAVEAILTAGHIPAGMELFTAGDESQMEVIKQWIDESDVCLLILGGRYGSIEPKTGKSYTHLEFEYAIAKGKPLFACVMKEEITDARVAKLGKNCLELENPKKLKEFRDVVLSRVSEFWEDLKDIKITIAGKLAQLARREDLVGWVRPTSQSVNPAALADEIARLSKENSDLRARVGEQDVKINGVSYLELINLLKKSGALDFLIANRDRLLHGVAANAEGQDLVARGLTDNRSGWIFLNENGKSFLNKLDAIAIANTK